MPFWKKKQTKTARPSSVEDGFTPSEKTLIGPGWCLKGRIYGKGQVVFQSTFDGELEIQGRMTVDTPATVNGMFRSEEIHIRGTMAGVIEGSRKVTLEKTARVDGEVNTPRLQMDTGAHLNGKVSMENAAASLQRQRK